MNGQHLRSLPPAELTKLIGERWKSAGLLKESEGPFVEVRFFTFHLSFTLFGNLCSSVFQMREWEVEFF